jgi:hypothetical protein
VRILDEADTDPRGAEAAVAGLFEARYPELVRLAGLLGADDPEDIAQEAFARLLCRYGSLRGVRTRGSGPGQGPGTASSGGTRAARRGSAG